MQNKLYDNHGRIINYVRLAVTDRCNLRCFYCMPEGIQHQPKSELLSFEEMYRVISILSEMGIHKVRITGGEPFLRKDLNKFIAKINKLEGINSIHLTTNGTLFPELIKDYKSIGISSVNLSLDTLDAERFLEITKRDLFKQVMQSLDLFLIHQIPLKINAVVMEGKNEKDILPLVAFAKHNKISVRFIEEMPFNGSGDHYEKLKWDYKKILSTIKNKYPSLKKIKDDKYSTSLNYEINNFKGSVGVIPAFSRTFCGSCNRIRITPQGSLKTCLYDDGVFNIKNLIRHGATDEQIKDTFLNALYHKPKDGYEAEQNRNSNFISESMTTIGG